jgi:beta-glucosidase
MATRSSKTSSRSPAPTPASNAAPRSHKARRFPKDFVWGASTASYQIEGAAGADGRGLSVWDSFCRQQGRIRNGDTGAVACDHYHRFPEDIALMKRLGLDAYRFSVAWPRLLPTGRSVVNPAGLAFYDRLIDGLLEAGITPWLCLYHWDLPQQLQDRGGWADRDCAGWFADYAALVARRYGDRIPMMATFNEPAVFTLFGYGFGNHAPGLADRTSYLRSIHHANLAHGPAVDAWRSHAPRTRIGAIHNQQPGRPTTASDEDRWAAAQFDAFWNRAFPDPQHLGHYPPALARALEPWVEAGDMTRIARPLDWFGMNHYSPTYVQADAGALFGVAWGRAPEHFQRTGMGWTIDPTAFRDMLENGCGADESPGPDGVVQDLDRVAYLDGYLRAMQEALDAGTDIRGYFVWSLLDNFEWAFGYDMRFGIVHVDYATQKRTPKASYEWYRDVIARKALPSTTS